MNRDEMYAASMDERLAYVNGRLENGESYEDILADLGVTKIEAGKSEPYGLGLIYVRGRVKSRPPFKVDAC